jgi:hypothetical protein
MKISQLAAKPQLIKMTLDDAETVAEYGEAVEFWTWDRQPMDVFMRLAAVDVANSATVIEAVKSLILDEDGRPVLTGEMTLPTRVMMQIITRIVESLGKS